MQGDQTLTTCRAQTQGPQQAATVTTAVQAQAQIQVQGLVLAQIVVQDLEVGQVLVQALDLVQTVGQAQAVAATAMFVAFLIHLLCTWATPDLVAWPVTFQCQVAAAVGQVQAAITLHQCPVQAAI